MNGPTVKVSRQIEASPGVIYRILSDYREAHPAILPRPYFSSLVVDEGGQGAGTVFRVTMKVMGTEQTLRMTVTEPEPGRVLREEDPTAGVTTTFTVEPRDSGALVTIATTWAPKRGLAGFMERLLNPLVARSLYRKELELLAARAAREQPT